MVGLRDRMNHLVRLSCASPCTIHSQLISSSFLFPCISSRSPRNCQEENSSECAFLVSPSFLCVPYAHSLNTLRTIARALANDPELLLLDEPTGDLDTKNTIEVMDLLLEINVKRKTTCIMVSHNPDVECYADRILYLEDGRFVKQALNAQQTPLIYDHYIQYINNQKASLEEGDPAYETHEFSSASKP